MQFEDQNVVENIKDGNAEAEKIFYEKYRQRLLPIALQNLPSEAEDLVQITMSKAFKAIKNGNYRGGSIAAWIFKIYSNVLNDKLKKETIPYKSHIPIDSQLNISTNDSSSPESLLYDKEIEESMMEAIKKLEGVKRKILFFRYIKEMTFDAISREINMKLGTVASNAYEAEEQLIKNVRSILKEKPRKI